MGVTTIQISERMKEELKTRKLFDSESYEEVIRDLIEDSLEISEETKKEIAKAEEDIRKGRVYTIKQVKKKLGF